MNQRGTLISVASLLLSLLGSGLVEAQTTDYTELSLEELSSVRIFTLGRKQATLFDTPNAASVVTSDDIHRSGALDLADSLRFAPGMQVSRIDSFNYAISARGFNDPSSSKLLVLMDGRSLYSTTSTGTYWNYHELFLEDVNRIEILRGPGASLWGANAMNGVINIVGKSAHETVGSLATIAHGTELDASVAVRHGFNIGNNAAARIYAKYQERENYGITRDTAADGWATRLVGGRFDWQSPAGGALTVIGEARNLTIWSRTELPVVTPPFVTVRPESQRTRGGNISAHWTQPVLGDGEFSALAAVERLDSTQVLNGEDRDTISLDLQLTLHPGARQELISGLTFRQDKDLLTQTAWTRYRDTSGTTRFTGAFVQDEISILPNRLLLTAGTKFERNTFSGWEIQPSVRAILRTAKKHRTWVGVSRAARTPSRMERNMESFGFVDTHARGFPLPIAIHILGTDNLAAEHVTAFELGHRYQPSPALSFDVSVFYNRYQDLRSIHVDGYVPAFTPVPRVDQYVSMGNNIYGSTRGGEFVVQWSPFNTLKLEGSVNAVRFDLSEYVPAVLRDPTADALTGSTPKQQYKLLAKWDPVAHWSLDLGVRHLDALPAALLPAYTGVDLRVGWRPRPGWELEAVARDVLDPKHGEASKNFVGAQVREFSRSFYLRASYRY